MLINGSNSGRFVVVLSCEKGARSGWYEKLGSKVIAFIGVYLRIVAFLSHSSDSSFKNNLYNSVFKVEDLSSGANSVMPSEFIRDCPVIQKELAHASVRGAL